MLKIKKEKNFNRLNFFIIIFITYLLLSPFVTLSFVYYSVQNSDEQELALYIDFNSLNKNIEMQLKEKAARVSKDWAQGEHFTNAGMYFTTEIAKSIAKSVATPQYLMRLFKYSASNEIGSAYSDVRQSSYVMLKSGAVNDFVSGLMSTLLKIDYSYDSLGQFSALIRREGSEIRLVFTRSGFGWKMTNMIMPV